MATPSWFNYEFYMGTKLAQMQKADPEGNWTVSKLVDAFAQNGFLGEDGAYNHFVQYGAAEEVAPNADFNPSEYYAAKAAQFYGVEPSAVTELQIANVKALINNAGMNAWTHYVQYGSNEGVNPSNAFDADAYLAAKAAAMGGDWTADSIAKAISDAGMTVLEHYLTYGGKGEGEVAEGATFPVADDQKVPSGEAGVAFTLTAGSATATASVFNGGLVYNQYLGTEAQTFNAGDKLTGTASSSDELNAVLNRAGAVAATVTGVETINLDVRAAASGLDMAHVTGAKAVNFDMSAAAVLNNVNMASAPEIGLSGNSELTVTATTLAGTADALTVNVENAVRGAGLTVLGGGALETLNLESTGTAKNILGVTAADGIVKTVVTGTADLDMNVTQALISGQTLDATQHEGQMNLIVDRNGATTATTNLTNVTGVETVTFVDSATGGDAVVATNIASGTDVVLTYSAGASSLSVKGAAANTADVLNVTIDNAADTTNTAIAGLTINDVETINFLSDGAAARGANSITELTVKSGATINVDGDSALALQLHQASTVENVTFSGAANHTFAFAAAATYAEGKDLTINASEATGNLTINGSNFQGTANGTAETLTITTGSGNDTITVTANANATNVINAGAGNDIVNVAGGAGTITLGEGSDTVAFTAVTGSALHITDFALGTGGDRLSADTVAAMTFGGQGTAAQANQLTVISAAANNATAIQNLFSANGESAVLVLNASTGVAELWYDADGSGVENAVQLASFDNITTLGTLTTFNDANMGTWA